MTDLADELDDWLTGGSYGPPLDDPDRAAMDVWADRLLRAIRRRRNELAQAEQVATAEMERVGHWLDVQRGRLDTGELKRFLAEYHRQLLEDDPDAKTLRLPSGELKSRTTDKWEWDDTAALAALLASPNENLIRRIPEDVKIDKRAAVKVLRVVGDGRVVDPHGVVVPGVTVETVTSFTVVTE